MANNLVASSPTYWSKVAHRNLIKKSIFRSVASFKEQGGLSSGLEVDRPYRALITTGKYTKGTALSAQDITTVSDKLTINDSTSAFIYYDKVDETQNSINQATEVALEFGRQMSADVDAAFLYTGIAAAASSVDDGDFSGTSGAPLTLSTSNVASVFSKAKLKLIRKNVDVGAGNLFAAISGEVHDILLQSLAGRESSLGDKRTEDGMVGTFMGFELFLTNNAPASIRITPTDNPSNTETLTVNGVTFTFVSTIGTAAGNILQTTDTAHTIDNLVALINAGGVGDGTLSVSLSAADQKKVQRWVAVDGTTYLDVYAKGASYMTVSDTADITYSRYTQHILAGVKGCSDVVVQIEPSVEMVSALSNGLHGKYVSALSIFGCKTFSRGADESVNIEINSASF